MEEAKVISAAPGMKVALPQTTWELLNEPGAYVEIGTGDLYRIPQEALSQGGSPMIAKQSLGSSRLVQLSKDPFITTFQARLLAAEHNIQPNF